MDMKVDEFIELGKRIRAEDALNPPKRPTKPMLVTKSTKTYSEPPKRVLLDLEAMSTKALLDRQTSRGTHFATTPFDVEGRMLRLYPGGVTIWSGFPGSGKTTLLRQFVCQLLQSGESVFLATLEENPMDTLLGLAATSEGKPDATADGIDWFKDSYSNRFVLWGEIGVANNADLLSTIRELSEVGLKHAVIDSLMCLDVANDDFEKQRQFANLVAATARACNVHIHLVAHPRKPMTANQEPDLNDVAGARELGGVADNVLFVRRSANATRDMGPDSVATPMNISIRKQRHFNGTHGDVSGWYRRDFRQFTKDQFAEKPISYLPDEAIKYLRVKDHEMRGVKLQ